MNDDTAKFYDKFYSYYPLLNIFLKPYKKRLFQEINKWESGKLLEIGVGDGSHFHLYETHDIIGIDTSVNMLERARGKIKGSMELYQMSGEDLRFESNTFDYIVLCHVISVVDNPERLLAECNRVLKQNGQIIILNHFTPKNWLRYIDKSFQFISNFFKFKSLFYLESLKTLSQFSLVSNISPSKLSYFRILIYAKRTTK